jgi:hypothetical protein
VSIFVAGLIPAFNVCPSLVGRVFLIAVLVTFFAMFVEAFYDVLHRIRQRRKRSEALALLDQWRRDGKTRFSCNGKARFSSEEGFSFVDD